MSRPARVFVSHAYEDGQRARQLISALSLRGIEVRSWNSLRDASQSWSDAIEKELAASDAAVCVITPAAADSELVQRQWEAILRGAWDQELRLIPVVQEGVVPPAIFSDRQWVKLPKAPRDDEWQAIAERIARTLDEGDARDNPFKQEARRKLRADLDRMGRELAPLVAAENDRRGR